MKRYRPSEPAAPGHWSAPKKKPTPKPKFENIAWPTGLVLLISLFIAGGLADCAEGYSAADRSDHCKEQWATDCRRKKGGFECQALWASTFYANGRSRLCDFRYGE